MGMFALVFLIAPPQGLWGLQLLSLLKALPLPCLLLTSGALSTAKATPLLVPLIPVAWKCKGLVQLQPMWQDVTSGLGWAP